MAIQMFDLGPGKLDFSPLASLGSNFIKSYDSAKKNALTEKAIEEFNANFGLGAPTGGMVPLASVSSKGAAAVAGPASLIQSESGGNWGATNDAVGSGGKVGHFGRLQFGQARIQDAANAGAIPQGTTPAQFTASPELQKKAENWHFGDIDNFIQANGYDKLVGQNIKGTPVTTDGMRAVAHLGGTGGLRKFIESGGQYDPSDRNGTSLSAYLAKHQGATSPLAPRMQIADPVALQRQPVQVAEADAPAPGAAPAQGFAIPQGGAATPNALSPRAMLLMRSLANPYLPEGQREVAKLLLSREMKTDDLKIVDSGAVTNLIDSAGNIRMTIPKQTNPLDDEGKRADIDLKRKNLGKSDAPTSVQEYEYAVKQGETRSYTDWAAAKAKAGATSVNVGGGGSDKQVFDTFAENTKEARAAANGLVALRQARAALKGGAITGAGAEGRLALQKIGAAFGVTDPTAIQNTETFRSAIAPQVSAIMKATVGSANISNSDREFAEKAAGGAITLDEGSINRLLDIMEKAGTARLQLHNEQLEAVYPDAVANKRERALFSVKTPEATPEEAPKTPDRRVKTDLPVRIKPGMTPDMIKKQFAPGTKIILEDGTERYVPYE